ncbi:hypothetical protein L3X38_019695 [Prunus dulcis]|uniref:Transmembrane protein n=1 Tax=Prunus dulcis TaxID=3755 RepID=A0AAD4WC74_PRUDU|nr:hypothetical protein L3X38_019695 [Prunus dulcis]
MKERRKVWMGELERRIRTLSMNSAKNWRVSKGGSYGGKSSKRKFKEGTRDQRGLHFWDMREVWTDSNMGRQVRMWRRSSSGRSFRFQLVMVALGFWLLASSISSIF